MGGKNEMSLKNRGRVGLCTIIPPLKGIGEPELEGRVGLGCGVKVGELIPRVPN